ncbi:hypothetical protein KBY24_02665 [Ruegeria pomeroyi]|uniref:DyP dimeric alpha+beta barrel domain-containing protein n=1 Tax=Ruegeria alba TaxID=2916756 RepID=A0ABS9NRR6_9RHOB|nr:hypothetical protein [Ruegeria alba]MCE8511449.1 hypothetical protein [Ruegeria pomeroyi]MCE8519880.1 hypothetical protein [Ruegeria pomeroyi]MCE8523996.1 hypothetical protein [Ruegeria pomeroyi]MCE8527881.1 hypothetical protein [Ruegeria pomeroyi]MCE8532276.1 hypothetical protein [Ruegeria pomeroyi]
MSNINPEDDFDAEKVQGNILRGYKHNNVRHLILEVTNKDAARRFLAASADGTDKTVPRITRSANWAPPAPEVCFNIGITFEGLRALGLPASQLATFPTEYAEGMAKRAVKLGDFGDSAPENWPSPFDQPDRIHIVASIYSNDVENFEPVEKQVAKAFTILGVRDGRNLPDGKVFFGYRDSISQPRFRHIFDPDMVNVDEPKDPLGTALLGYPTHFEGVEFAIPEPKEVFHDCSFNAFRVLQQKTDAFETYLSEAATKLEKHPKQFELLSEGAEANICGGMSRHDALREVVAAQMCGRWRNGTPYELSPDSDEKGDLSLTNYDYTLASRCPAGAHMRRANPRGGPIVQRVSNYSRRIVRRGMSYGPDPETGEHGLLGNFIGANYGAQFEAVMCDWINFGLQDPRITGSNDPLLGANVPETSVFDLTLRNGGHIRLSGFPRFVIARGGAYTLLPSLPAIRYLAQLSD